MWGAYSYIWEDGRSPEARTGENWEKGRAAKVKSRRPLTSGTGILARSRRRSASGEYRTYFHISKSWGIHESTVCRIVGKVENILIKSGAFRLPGKKELYQQASEWKVMVVDVTETPVESPKKTASLL